MDDGPFPLCTKVGGEVGVIACDLDDFRRGPLIERGNAMSKTGHDASVAGGAEDGVGIEEVVVESVILLDLTGEVMIFDQPHMA